jgi:hypothetical protein
MRSTRSRSPVAWVYWTDAAIPSFATGDVLGRYALGVLDPVAGAGRRGRGEGVKRVAVGLVADRVHVQREAGALGRLATMFSAPFRCWRRGRALRSRAPARRSSTARSSCTRAGATSRATAPASSSSTEPWTTRRRSGPRRATSAAARPAAPSTAPVSGAPPRRHRQTLRRRGAPIFDPRNALRVCDDLERGARCHLDSTRVPCRRRLPR